VIGPCQRGRKARQQLEETIRTKRQHKWNVAAALFISALVCFVILRESLIPSLVIFIAAALMLLLFGSTYRWIEYRPVSLQA
jgi:cell division protein FtsW (lipid II flippase)